MSAEIFIIFISKYSETCKQISETLQFIMPHFNTKIVDIDNPETRTIIKNSSQNKITTVPSAILIYPQTGKTEVLEGQKFVNLITQGVEMVKQKMYMEQQAQQQAEQAQLQAQQAQQAQQRIQRAKPIEEISEEDGDLSRDGRHSSLDSLIEDEEDGQSDFEIRMKQEIDSKKRRKIGKNVQMPDRQFSAVGDDGMIGGIGELPERGAGHENMKNSSLNDADLQFIDRNMNHPPRTEYPLPEEEGEKKMAMVNTGKGMKKHVHFIEDVTEEDESQGRETKGMSMEDILGEQGSGMAPSKETQKKSSQLKSSAETLAAQRNEIMKQEENLRKKVKAI